MGILAAPPFAWHTLPPTGSPVARRTRLSLSDPPTKPADGPEPYGKGSFFRSTRWNSVGAGSVQLVRFGVSLVLFKELRNEIVGLMAMALVVTGFLDWFKDFGTGQAVVQAKKLEPGFLSTVFFTNMALAVVLSILVAATAQPVAWLFGEPELAPLLPWLGLSFIITAFGLVQRNIYVRLMRFDRLAAANLINAVVYGAVAIWMAYNGYKVWSLVVGTLAGYVASNLSLWLGSTWRPRMVFSKDHLQAIKPFCLGMLGSNMSNYLFQNVDRLVVGRFLGAGALGYYALGLRLINFPVRAISRMLLSVMLPTFSRLQDDMPEYQAKFLRACAGITLIVAPMMAGLAVTADPLVHGFMNDDWSPAIPIIIVMTPLGLIYSVAGLASTIYVSMGRTTELFRWSVIFGILVFVGYCAGLPWGVLGVATSATITHLMLSYLYFAVPFKMIDLKVTRLWTSMTPMVIASLAMGLLVFGLRLVLERAGLGPKATVFLCAPAGLVIYAAMIWRARPPALSDLMQLLGGKARRAGLTG